MAGSPPPRLDWKCLNCVFAGPKCVQLIFRDSIQLRQPHSDLLFCLKLLRRSSRRFGASLLQLLLFAWPRNLRTFGGRACNVLTSRVLTPSPQTQSFCWHEYLTKPFCQIKMVKNILTVLQKYDRRCCSERMLFVIKHFYYRTRSATLQYLLHYFHLWIFICEEQSSQLSSMKNYSKI